jgi:hypothetical protein
VKAYSLELTILDIKLRNTRYNIDTMSWGKLEIKERPIIPEGIVSKKLSTVATVEFPGLMPNTEIDLFDNSSDDQEICHSFPESRSHLAADEACMSRGVQKEFGKKGAYKELRCLELGAVFLPHNAR